VNTVRVHLARIMAKTDTNKQTELVRLLERVSGFRAE
jgi:DNA-binding CsgD family transcriptional regulator